MGSTKTALTTMAKNELQGTQPNSKANPPSPSLGGAPSPARRTHGTCLFLGGWCSWGNKEHRSASFVFSEGGGLGWGGVHGNDSEGHLFYECVLFALGGFLQERMHCPREQEDRWKGYGQCHSEGSTFFIPLGFHGYAVYKEYIPLLAESGINIC